MTRDFDNHDLMYNLKLKNKQIRIVVVLPFDDIVLDDEWITEEGDDIVEIEQAQGEYDGENVEIQL